MVKLDLITKKNDECYTPKYAIEPILEYIPDNSTVWCPFDTIESNYVKLLKDKGCDVVYSHISDGKDFFNYFPKEHIEYIISNPPYSLKADVFERLFWLKVPFAMLVGVVGLFESQRRFKLFANNPFEIMYLNKRVSFFNDFTDVRPKLNPPFSSVYLCSGVLPNQIVFKTIDKLRDK